MGFLDKLEPIYSVIPTIKPPKETPTLRSRLAWTGAILLIFFILGQIPLLGLDEAAAGQFAQFQMILASNIGTVLTAGIGPIVIASLVLQLLAGAKVIDLNMSDPVGRAKYMGIQKLFAIVMCIIEPFAYALGGLLIPSGGISFFNPNLFLIVAQVALGSLILLYLDDISSKYGIGSGIGLFIAAGISAVIFWRLFNPFSGTGLVWWITNSAPQGLFFATFYYLTQASLINVLLSILPILFTLAIFAFVAYVEGMHIDLPITFGGRGYGSRYPIKFLYASNIPVIFAAMLFANIQLWASMAQGTFLDPWIGHFEAGQLVSGFAYYTTAPFGFILNLVQQGLGAGLSELGHIAALTPGSIFHVFAYMFLMIAASTAFGLLWLEVSGTGSRQVAAQLHGAGHQIAGYRHDSRIYEKVLNKYIPPSAFIGSAAVGFLAAGADIMGTLSSGTGILLTVGIVFRIYEDIKKWQIEERDPLVAKFISV